jgi:hypothetical protein
MILYEQDWKRYPSAIIDYETKNASWLRQAQVYHSMGIKNSAFLLALIQSELQGIDPHRTDLDLETKVKIGLECRFNPWYYFREVMRVPAQGGAHALQLKANRGNIAMYWTFFNNIDVGLIQPRQTGKSLSVDGLMVELTYVSAQNSRINMVTKDDTLRKENVDRLKNIRGLLPPYLVSLTKDDSDNMFELTCKMLGNKYVTGVAQNSESAANNLGRGLTSPIQQFDEGPFITFIGTTIPAALAAGTAAKAEAAAAGNPNANIFTTTAGKMDDRDGKFMYELFSEAAPWNEAFLDAANRTEFVEMITRNKTGRKLMVNVTMSHRQLGYTDEWLYEAIANAKASGEAADRDFFNRWTSGSLRSPLSIALNETIRRSHQDVVWMELSPERYAVNWYHPKEELAMMEDVPFIVGLDTSDAVGRDSIAMVITNAYDLSVVGVGSYNETNLIRFAEYLAYLLIRYPNMTLVIERRSSGMSIIDALTIHLVRNGIDPFKRMYNDIVDDATQYPQDYKEVCGPVQYRNNAFYDKRKSSFGVATGAQERQLWYTTVLQNAAKMAGNQVKDLSLINEITGLVEKNGRIDHNASGHDDHVIAWLLTHWFLFHCKNLTHYGIDPTIISMGVSEDGKEMTDDDRQAKLYQDDLMCKIEAIAEELKEETNHYVIAKLESQIKAISSRLTSMNINAPSIDALIRLAQDERDKRYNGPTNGNKPMDRTIDITQMTKFSRR